IAATLAAVLFMRGHVESTGKVGAIGFCFGRRRGQPHSRRSPDLAAGCPITACRCRPRWCQRSRRRCSCHTPRPTRTSTRASRPTRRRSRPTTRNARYTSIPARGTCPWRIHKLRCCRHLEQTVAMVPPSVMVKGGMGGRRLARSFSRSAAAKRLVNAIVIVIISEFFQLSPQVDCVPDQHVVKKLPSYRPDQPFHERMRYRHERDRLDLFDLEYAQVGEPTMETK